MKSTTILGISAYYHDSAAALIVNGEIIAAAQEERFSRIKNDASFPAQAILAICKMNGVKLKDIDAVVFYDKPFLKFERILETYYATIPKAFATFQRFLPEWSQKKLFLRSKIKKELQDIFKEVNPVKLFFSSHHLSHAASAFYPSPFNEAAILTIDAVGEWSTCSIGVGKEGSIKLIKEMNFPNSIGIIYSSFTYFLGFKVNSGEYKMMGLSPFGDFDSARVENFISIIKSLLVTVFDDGSIEINQYYFKYRHGLKMIHEKRWVKLFNMKRRGNDQEIEQVHADLACAIQKVTTEIILKLARTAKVLTGCKNLCLAGGVALNSVANGEIRNSSLFEKIWIQPAAGDAGGALGAALAFYYLGGNQVNRIVERSDGMRYGFLGTALVDKEIEMFCKRNHLKYDYFKDKNLLNHVIAKDLVQNKIVGWVQGRMEFGPRALGARSILASPFEADMQHKLNMAVKFREDFRPFAPVMLLGEAEKYFGVSDEIPFMQYVYKLKEEARIEENNSIKTNSLVDKLNVPRSPFQAVTHVDYSARMQVVDNENHPLYGLLQKFKEETGIGMLVNTSFNTNGEPIVCSIEDAFACFNKTKIDILVLNNYIFRK